MRSLIAVIPSSMLFPVLRQASLSTRMTESASRVSVLSERPALT
jgi:hypothetical protein